MHFYDHNICSIRCNSQLYSSKHLFYLIHSICLPHKHQSESSAPISACTLIFQTTKKQFNTDPKICLVPVHLPISSIKESIVFHFVPTFLHLGRPIYVPTRPPNFHLSSSFLIHFIQRPKSLSLSVSISQQLVGKMHSLFNYESSLRRGRGRARVCVRCWESSGSFLILILLLLLLLPLGMLDPPGENSKPLEGGIEKRKHTLWRRRGSRGSQALPNSEMDKSKLTWTDSVDLESFRSIAPR